MRTGRRRIVGALAAVAVSLMPSMVGAHARGEWVRTARVVPTSVPMVRVCAGLTHASLPPLPAGYKRYISRDLPYSVGYPGTWTVYRAIMRDPQGHRTPGIYYDVDGFYDAHLPAHLSIRGEPLLPAIGLDADSYTKAVLLDLWRARSYAPGFALTVRRIGTMTVDGTRANLVVFIEDQNGEEFRTTQAIWVAGGEGWQVGVNTPAVQKAPVLPTLRPVLGTFRQCAS